MHNGGPLPSVAFTQREAALSEAGVHVSRLDICECCGAHIWLIELDRAGYRWADAVLNVGNGLATWLEWAEHDRERCQRARARARAAAFAGIEFDDD